MWIKPLVPSLFILLFGVEFCAASMDWSEVAQIIHELKTTIRSTMILIKTIAIQDNAKVGETISSELDSSFSHSAIIMKELNTAVNKKSLTKQQTMSFVRKLMNGVEALLTSMGPELGQLSEPVRNKIYAVCSVEVGTLERKEAEILILLRDGS